MAKKVLHTTLKYTLFRIDLTGRERIGQIQVRNGEHKELYGTKLNFKNPIKEIVSGGNAAVLANN